MKNMLRTKKESLAINDMWREKIFQKWTKFWRIRWTFLLCFSEILYIASAMSSWSALYQNGNKGRKRRKNQVVASLTSLSQQSRINHHASPSRQLMFNIRLQEGAAELGEEESEVVEVRRDPAWTCLTSSAPWALLLLREGFQGKKENVQWFVFYRKLGPRWVIQVGTSLGILSSITGGCVLSDIRKTVLASTVYTRIFPGFTDPNNRNFIYISVIFPSMLKALYLCPQYIFWDFPWVSPLIILVWGLSLGVILPSRIYTAAAADQAVTCGH